MPLEQARSGSAGRRRRARSCRSSRGHVETLDDGDPELQGRQLRRRGSEAASAAGRARRAASGRTRSRGERPAARARRRRTARSPRSRSSSLPEDRLRAQCRHRLAPGLGCRPLEDQDAVEVVELVLDDPRGRAPPARAGRACPRRRAPRASPPLGRSTGTSTPWSERQPSSSVSQLLTRIDDRRVHGGRAPRPRPRSGTRTRGEARPPGCAARPTPFASAISACIRSTRRRRSSSKSSTSSARSFSTGSGHCRIWASASRRLASFSALSSSSMTWPCSLCSHASSSVFRGSADRRRPRRPGPPFRIAGAAAASARPARAASAPGRSVLATSCARWRPRSRRSGAGQHRRRRCLSPGGLAGARQRRLQLLQRLHRRVGLRPGDDDANQVTEGRVAQRLAALQLAGQEAPDVVPGGELDRPRVGLERLDQDAAGGVAAAAARELGEELERTLLGPEVRKREARVRVDDRRQRDPFEVVALRDHLRAEQHRPVGRGEPLERRGRVARCPRRAGSARARARAPPVRARAAACRRRAGRARPSRTRGRARVPARRGRSDGSAVLLSPWRTSATSQFGQRRVTPHVRQWIAGTSPRRFSSRIALPPFSAIVAELGEQRSGQRVPALAPQVDDPHRRQLPAEPAAELEPLERRPALGSRRRASEDGDGPLERRPLGRDRAGVVAGIGLLLVRRVVLLVDADRARGRAPARRPPNAHRRRRAPRRRRSARARRGARPPSAPSGARRSASPKRARKRPSACGVSAISGTRTIAPRPRSSAAAQAWR